MPGCIMEDLLSLARRPPVTIAPDATVRALAALLLERKVGAALVLDERGGLAGIVSERDVVGRLVATRADPDTTTVADIMTKEVRTARASDSSESALQMMVAGHFRHLPIVDADGKAIAMLSLRHLLSEQVGALSRRNADLMNYIETDGPGG
jgi:CBS domain-containing protein